jgi:hypothetical protein
MKKKTTKKEDLSVEPPKQKTKNHTEMTRGRMRNLPDDGDDEQEESKV